MSEKERKSASPGSDFWQIISSSNGVYAFLAIMAIAMVITIGVKIGLSMVKLLFSVAATLFCIVVFAALIQEFFRFVSNTMMQTKIAKTAPTTDEAFDAIGAKTMFERALAMSAFMLAPMSRSDTQRGKDGVGEKEASYAELLKVDRLSPAKVIPNLGFEKMRYVEVLAALICIDWDVAPNETVGKGMQKVFGDWTTVPLRTWSPEALRRIAEKSNEDVNEDLRSWCIDAMREHKVLSSFQRNESGKISEHRTTEESCLFAVLFPKETIQILTESENRL